MDTNKSSSIIMGNCLHCQGMVRVPAKASVGATVRCPHCSESFPLKQILETAVPELELVIETPEDDMPHADRPNVVVDSSGKRHEKFVVPPQLAKGAIRRSRRHRSRSRSSSSENDASSSRSESDPSRVDSGSPTRSVNQSSSSKSESIAVPESFAAPELIAVPETIAAPELLVTPEAFAETEVFAETESFSGVEVQPNSGSQENDIRPEMRERSQSGSQRRSGSGGSRHKRKKAAPSSFVEMLKIGLGGLMAFPIAYLLVFWVFKKDPLQLGPPIGEIVPFVVPEQLRKQPQAGDSKTDSNPAGEAGNALDEDAFKPMFDSDVKTLPTMDIDPELN